MAMTASTPIISTKVKPRRRGLVGMRFIRNKFLNVAYCCLGTATHTSPIYRFPRKSGHLQIDFGFA